MGLIAIITDVPVAAGSVKTK